MFLRNVRPQWNIIENMTLFNQSVKWFDDVSTSSVTESIEDIAYQSLVDTVDYLASKKGLNTDDIDEWLWGNYHTLNVDHLAGLVLVGLPPHCVPPRFPTPGHCPARHNS